MLRVRENDLRFWRELALKTALHSGREKNDRMVERLWRIGCLAKEITKMRPVPLWLKNGLKYLDFDLQSIVRLSSKRLLRSGDDHRARDAFVLPCLPRFQERSQGASVRSDDAGGTIGREKPGGGKRAAPDFDGGRIDAD